MSFTPFKRGFEDFRKKFAPLNESAATTAAAAAAAAVARGDTGSDAFYWDLHRAYILERSYTGADNADGSMAYANCLKFVYGGEWVVICSHLRVGARDYVVKSNRLASMGLLGLRFVAPNRLILPNGCAWSNVPTVSPCGTQTGTVLLRIEDADEICDPESADGLPDWACCPLDYADAVVELMQGAQGAPSPSLEGPKATHFRLPSAREEDHGTSGSCHPRERRVRCQAREKGG